MAQEDGQPEGDIPFQKAETGRRAGTFQEESSPKIHVRTWTPKRANQTKDDFSPEDFFIPNN